jgi:N5-(carboxyethyl)ornithine synthase
VADRATTVGLAIPDKENERRRALLPDDLAKMTYASSVVVEEGYGLSTGVSDEMYVAAGATVAPRPAVMSQQVVCTMKSPSDRDFGMMAEGQTLFCWVHAVQGREVVDRLIDKRMSAVAWEDMFRAGRHVFWLNNRIAGYAAILHVSTVTGESLEGRSAAVIGRGNVAEGAHACLTRLGARVRVYDRETEGLLREEIGCFDLVVNAVLWDVFRTDHIVYRDDLARMKPGSWIVDVSCDEAMGIESSRPTTIEDPVYLESGIWHYVVDHTPAILHRDATRSVSAAVWPYLDLLCAGRDDEVLSAAYALRDGVITDARITRFQGR